MPASLGQRLLWLLQRSVGTSGALNCPVIVRIRGRLDPAKLCEALTLLVARHESLRTTFTGAAHRLTQVVHDPPPVEFDVIDLRGPSAEAELDAALAAELGSQIDFAVWPTRTRLWQVGEHEHVLCLTMHHLVTDAWSCGLLYRELGALLDQLATGTTTLEPPIWQYRDFSAWQNEFLRGPHAVRYHEFWARQLAGMELPAVPLGPRPPRRQRTTALVERTIGPAPTHALRGLARTERTTPFAVMLAAFYAVLHRSTGQDDLAVTSLFANRSQREVSATVGFLANMVVLRARIPARLGFADLVARAAGTARDAFVHERLPYQLLPIGTSNTATQRAEDVVFQMLGEPIKVATRAAGLVLEGVVPRGVARFDLELAVIPHEGGMRVCLFHAADRLAADVAGDIVDSYVALVNAVAADPGIPVAALPAGHGWS